MNTWIADHKSQSQANSFASEIINKLCRNCYGYITSCRACRSKGEQLQFSEHPIYGVVYLFLAIYSQSNEAVPVLMMSRLS